MKIRKIRYILNYILRSTRAAWLVVGLTIVLILFLEWGLRLVFAAKDAAVGLPIVDPRIVAEGYDGADWVEDLYQEQARLEAKWEPYVHYRLQGSQGGHINIGANLLRRTWNVPATEAEAKAKAKALRVFVFGGSTAWGMGARDEKTIPSEIARALARNGVRAELVNYAQIGHISTQSLLELQMALMRGDRPDVVIFLDGVNDTLAALQNGSAGGLVNTENRRQEFNILSDPGRLLGAFVVRNVEDSAMFRLAKSLGNRLIPARSSAPPEHYRHVEGADLNRLAEEVLANHQANRELVTKLGEAYGFSSLFFWQPVVFTKEKATSFEQEMAEQYALLQPIFNQINKRTQYNFERNNSQFPPIHDLTEIFDDDSALRFTDFCHLTEAANRILGEAIAEEMIALVDEQANHP